ncbi:hypothetical protein C8R43DRAFT_1020709 [Mycena crocata]|nr:hypothetical protein C8R43DRAFT_1020709 [Mycena crocata]
MQVSRIVSLSSSIVRHHRVLYSTSRGFSVPRAKLPEVPPQPLPSLFASVQSITQADIDHYVAPLFDWNWRVFMEMPNLILSENSLERAARNVPMLGKKFWFLRSRAAANFLVDVVDLAGKEKHDPRITLFLGKMKQHVVVRMHTPRTLEVADALSEENVQPGLSASDVRLAIRLENLFQDKYSPDGHGRRRARPLPSKQMQLGPQYRSRRSLPSHHPPPSKMQIKYVRITTSTCFCFLCTRVDGMLHSCLLSEKTSCMRRRCVLRVSFVFRTSQRRFHLSAISLRFRGTGKTVRSYTFL